MKEKLVSWFEPMLKWFEPIIEYMTVTMFNVVFISIGVLIIVYAEVSRRIDKKKARQALEQQKQEKEEVGQQEGEVK